MRRRFTPRNCLSMHVNTRKVECSLNSSSHPLSSQNRERPPSTPAPQHPANKNRRVLVLPVRPCRGRRILAQGHAFMTLLASYLHHARHCAIGPGFTQSTRNACQANASAETTPVSATMAARPHPDGNRHGSHPHAAGQCPMDPQAMTCCSIVQDIASMDLQSSLEKFREGFE